MRIPSPSNLVEQRLGGRSPVTKLVETGSDDRRRRSTEGRRVPAARFLGVSPKDTFVAPKGLHHGLGRYLHDRRVFGVALPHPLSRGWRARPDDGPAGGGQRRTD